MNKQQLANKIWAAANKMRSKIDANEYKDYILGLIFYKFLSDNEVNYLHGIGWTDEELPELVEDYNDKNLATTIEDCKRSIGYFIEYKNLFSTWLLPDSTFTVADLSVALSRFDGLISPTYKHIFEGIFVTLRTGLSKLGENPTAQTKALKDLVKLIKDIPVDGNQDYDVLGYVYEYLISKFAASAGKKAGEFYTPREVAMLMSEIVAEHHKDKQKIEIYDPTSGSGSLLLTIGKSVGRHIEDRDKVKYFAQELKENTYNLTRMNLVMRGIKPGNITTRCADSLDEDWPIQKKGPDSGKPLYVDAVVSNPPYSQHWNPTDAELDARFKDYGVAPKSKADYAFLLHELHHIKSDGILTIVLPHGVLFRGNPEDDGEGKIRKKLIEKNQIDAIIGLPANIFFGTSIPTLVMVLKQHRENDDILIIDASKKFVKDGKQNKLRASDIKRIADAWRDRADIPGFSRKVLREEVRENGYNLNIPRYIDSSEAPEQYDIYATMFGGIPNVEIKKLQQYWDVFPQLHDSLFEEEKIRPYSRLKGDNIEGVTKQSKDIARFKNTFYGAFDGFADKMNDTLVKKLSMVKVMQAHDELSEDIFHRLAEVSLVDCYDVYQVFSDQWQTISNDIETIQMDGLDAVRGVEEAKKIVKKGDEEIEVPDGMKGRILPFEMVQKDRFQEDLRKIADLELRGEEINGELDEIRDGFTEDESQEYLEGEDTPKFDKAKIKKDVKAKGGEIEDETKVKLVKLVALWDEQTKIGKTLKTARQKLIDKTIETIQNLTDKEVLYYLNLKWIVPVDEEIHNAADIVIETLIDKVKNLAKKYSTPYKELVNQLEDSQKRLAGLIAQLEGDKSSIEGLNELMNSIKE